MQHPAPNISLDLSFCDYYAAFASSSPVHCTSHSLDRHIPHSLFPHTLPIFHLVKWCTKDFSPRSCLGATWDARGCSSFSSTLRTCAAGIVLNASVIASLSDRGGRGVGSNRRDCPSQVESYYCLMVVDSFV